MKSRILIVGLALAVVGGAGRADSLWKSGNASLVTDRKASRVGDLITILITETSSASQQANTSVSSKAKTAVAPGIGPLLKMIPKFAFDGSTDSTAQGSTSRTANLAARITVKVASVKPNGDLVLEGTRNVTANNETQVIKITGEVRPQDVLPDNTVLSTYVADAQIVYTGKGPIAERQKPGIVTRIFKLLF